MLAIIVSSVPAAIALTLAVGLGVAKAKGEVTQRDGGKLVVLAGALTVVALLIARYA